MCQVYEVGRMQGAEDKQVSWDAQENKTLCTSPSSRAFVILPWPGGWALAYPEDN